MRLTSLVYLFSFHSTLSLLFSSTLAEPYVHDETHNLSYRGIATSPDAEAFLGIPYGVSTAGLNRFAPPQPFLPPPGHIYNGTAAGHSCPQLSDTFIALVSPVTDIDEDCLNLNVVRPAGWNKSKGLLPVMVWIYGGGFNIGSANDESTAPDGLIRKSVENGLPVLFVAMNYRLGMFGFAASEALRGSKSLNNGLRDQRLALEWIQENIAAFGGDPTRVTIFGESSGGLSVGLQVLAYGASRPIPFRSAIMESTALEPGMSSNITFNATTAIAVISGCLNSSSSFTFEPQSASQSPAVISCLRSLSMETLLNNTAIFSAETMLNNGGDIFLPAVDQDFLPFRASDLVSSGAFPPIPLIIGWQGNDATLFTHRDISTPADTEAFVSLYFPALNSSTVSELVGLYPSSDFSANDAANLSAEFYRSAEITRDIYFSCPSLLFGSAMAKKYATSPAATSTERSIPPVYLYSGNQSLLAPIFAASSLPGLGVMHGSEGMYIFSNIELANVTLPGYKFSPSVSDYALAKQMPKSWTSFAWVDTPSPGANNTLPGWKTAYPDGQGNGDVYVIGGGRAGMAGANGEFNAQIKKEALRKRCGFLNSPAVIDQLMY